MGSNLYNVIGVNEAASILNVSPGYVKNLCTEGKIVAKKIGKTWVIDRSRLKGVR
ncbi:helix-turn-helix domain-containing protein [Bacillus cereus]|uniref:helix-turn-helix domain-containing protein n=1 Tax=Bacillus cereus TaxID=1396 RepID=UPI001D0E368F|nr:helix-turn-helix domain-containing protein [Bacillus cereus]MCC2361684.1 helix-turn-helix domain-containing protein [Bacillus cereus]